MRHVAVLLLAVLVELGAGAADSSAQEADNPFMGGYAKIRAHCSAEWPTDFAMQEYCQENAQEAYHKVRRMAQDHAGLPEDDFLLIVVRCLEDWSPWEGGRQETYDYSMIEYCMTNQVAAYRRLNRGG